MNIRLRAPLVGALVLALTACAGATGPSGTPPVAPEPSTPAGASQGVASAFDQAFIDMMVPHHQSATEMAELAQERAEHEELRTLAGEIIAAQETEITQMRDWREEWFGSAETPPMDAMPLLPGMEMSDMDMDMGDGHTMDMTVDIEELRDAEPFDLAFLDAMIPHHESAIEAGEIALGESESPEIRSLAEEIISSQQAEIDQMTAWRSEWYPGD
ncbi:MAG: DUF305 domain-containing protein [Chloroflexota bacterium]|nr:DUF305 domain-containing protein [Chloroflexota bacterium]